MKKTMAGTGYVGLSLAVLWAQCNEETVVDVIPEQDEKINKHSSPIQDEYIEKYLTEKDFSFKPNTSLREGLRKFAEWYKEFYGKKN